MTTVSTPAEAPPGTLQFLHAPRLRLRLLEKTDVDALTPFFSDDAVTCYLQDDSWRSAEDAQTWGEECCAMNAAGKAAWFVCIENATNRIIGTCVLFNYDPLCRRVEIGYTIAREYWKQGFAFEATATLINHAFTALGLARIEAVIHVSHAVSQRVALKLGFTREGLLRNWRLNNKGELHDVVIFSLLKDDARPSSAS